MLEPSNFEKSYRSCIVNFLSITEEKHLCTDCKTMIKKLDFDSSSHTFSDFSSSEMSSMAQVYIDHKSNEINAIKILLEQIELKDTLISIDAMGTKNAIAEQIKDSGLATTRNNVIKQAQGKYICFVDADDYIIPTYCEELLRIVLKNYSDIVMMQGVNFDNKSREYITIRTFPLNGTSMNVFPTEIVCHLLQEYQ